MTEDIFITDGGSLLDILVDALLSSSIIIWALMWAGGDGMRAIWTMDKLVARLIDSSFEFLGLTGLAELKFWWQKAIGK